MSRQFNRLEILQQFGQNQSVMNYFGINLRLFLDGSPIKNYKNSRGL